MTSRRWAAVAGALLAAVPSTATAATTDGQLVTIEQRAGGGEALVTYNVPLSGRHEVYAGGDLSAPQWSPDGNRILFAEGGMIKVYSAVSGQVADVVAGSAPTWTDDGTGVTFVRGAQVVTRTATGAETVLEGADGTGATDLAWFPAGEVLTLLIGARVDAYIVPEAEQANVLDGIAGPLALGEDGSVVYPRRGDAGTSLFRAADDMDSDDEPLTDEPGAADTDPDISPTGRIIFTRTVGKQTQLGLLDAEGRNLSTFGGGQSEPDWQPCVEVLTQAPCRSATPVAGRPGQECRPASSCPGGAPRSAAPRLTLKGGRLKLDKRGRVTVRGTCDRACTVTLRVRVKLTSGRVIVGRAVRAQAAAGGAVKLRLRRGALPPRRKVAWARVSGKVVGADGRSRAVRIKLR